MSSVPKILKIAVYVIVAAIAITSGVVLVRNAIQKTQTIHEDSATDPKGVYEVYNDTLVTGNQVLTAIITYGNYDAPEPDKGLCRVQTGKTKDADIDWSDYRYYKVEDTKDNPNPNWINPDGVFRATLVYGRDLPNTPENAATIANFPNELQWIQFIQVKQHDDPENITPGPVTPDPTIPPGGQPLPTDSTIAKLTVTGEMSLWEGTARRDITPSTQGLTIYYGSQDVTDSAEIDWYAWDTTINDGSQVQRKTFSIGYKGKTAEVKIWVYKDLTLTVSTNDTVDGHPVSVKTNHPDYQANINSFTGDERAEFKFISYEDNDLDKLFNKLTTQGYTQVPAHDDYVVANTKQGGATALAEATMTVGFDDIRYTAKRSKQQRIVWSPLEVEYFNYTADEAYRNSDNYTDEETSLINGAKDADAGTESLIATGDIIRLTCNTAADVDYEYKGWFSQQWSRITGEGPIYDATNIPGDKDYTGSNLQYTVVSLKALRATEVGEAKVTFTDKVTGFQVASDERFWTLYTPFSFEIPPYNLDTNSAIVRDDSYDTTDLVVTGSKSLTTTNDKKLYVDKLLDANDNGVATPEFVYAQYSKANSLTAQETVAATTANGAANNYTLACQTQYSNKNASTNKQGRSHLSAVYVDFGSRYTKEKIVYVWYPLKVEFTRPYDLAWNRDTNYTKVYTAEAVVATASQRDSAFSWTADDLNATKISGGVDGTIKVDNYASAAPCKAAITNTYSSRSFAFTLKKRGSVKATATRPRTSETVVAPAIDFRPSVPDNLYNLTSAAATRKDVDIVNDDTNRLACGDEFNYSYDPIESYGFKVYKGDACIKYTYSNPAKRLVSECVSDGTNLDVSDSEGLVALNENSIRIAAADSDIFYAIEYTPINRQYWFVDNPITKFENDAESKKGFNVYRFTDDYVNGFSDGFTIANIDDYKAWCHDNTAVVLAHQYTASYSNASGWLNNVTLSLATQTVENNLRIDSVRSDTPGRNNAELTITSGNGSIKGTETSVKVSHDQFYGRTKEIKWLTFTNLDKEIHLVEMHEATINVGEGASDYLELTGLPAKKRGTNTEKRVKTSDTKKFEFELGRNNANLTKDKGYPQKVEITSNAIEIITKQSGNQSYNIKLKNTRNNKNDYKITVNVHDFEANVFNLFIDNYGYQWSRNGNLSSGNARVLIPNKNTNSILVGDSLAVVANSSGYDASFSDNNNNKISFSQIDSSNVKQVKDFTTLSKTVSNQKGFLYANSFFGYDLYKEGECPVKYYSTKTDSVVSALVTNYEDPYCSLKKTLKVTDSKISDYWKNRSLTNSSEKEIKFRSMPGVWFVTGECLVGETDCVSETHNHIASYAFANSVYPHGITYNEAGTQAIVLGNNSTAEQKIAKYTDRNDITYLNVSEFNKLNVNAQ